MRARSPAGISKCTTGFIFLLMIFWRAGSVPRQAIRGGDGAGSTPACAVSGPLRSGLNHAFPNVALGEGPGDVDVRGAPHPAVAVEPRPDAVIFAEENGVVATRVVDGRIAASRPDRRIVELAPVCDGAGRHRIDRILAVIG